MENFITERILKIIDYYGLNTSSFEQKINVSNGLISKSIARKSAIKSDICAKILEVCPEIDAYWLITGRGSMLFSELEKPEKALPKVQNSVRESFNDSVKILYEERIKAKDAHIHSLEERITEQSRYIKILIEEHGQELQAILDVTKANEKMLTDGTEYINHLRPVVQGYKLGGKEIAASAKDKLPED